MIDQQRPVCKVWSKYLRDLQELLMNLFQSIDTLLKLDVVRRQLGLRRRYLLDEGAFCG